MHVLVLQHIACEPPGAYEDVLRERGATIHRVELDEHDPLPDWRGFEAIIAMGGPMSVNDEERLPWLRDEKALINNAVRAGVPFFGACLGAQLLSASLGGIVFQGAKPEVGLLPVFLTSEAASDPVFTGIPREMLTFQWHSDTFSLPSGSVLLASSPAFPPPGLSLGRPRLWCAISFGSFARHGSGMAAGAGICEVAERQPWPGFGGDAD